MIARFTLLPASRKYVLQRIRMETGGNNRKRPSAMIYLSKKWQCTVEEIQARLDEKQPPKPKLPAGKVLSISDKDLRERCEAIVDLVDDARSEAVQALAHELGISYQRVAAATKAVTPKQADPTPAQIAAMAAVFRARYDAVGCSHTWKAPQLREYATVRRGGFTVGFRVS